MNRVADYLINFIYKKGTDTIFTVAGGGAMFLNDAVILQGKIKSICNHHEQACAMAAEAYSKSKHVIGAVMVTSGPGSTNAITGLMEAYQNSIPVIYISSQTKTAQMVANSGIPSLRQFGTQEVDIIPVVSPLTKYAAYVTKPEDIRYHLEKAYYIALHGRPGPVWLDIPSDIAASPLPPILKSFKAPATRQTHQHKKIQQIVALIKKSKRPLIIAGGGIKQAGAKDIFREFVQHTHIPVVTPSMGIDILEYDHPSYVGHGGTKGDRAANIVIQKSDLIISLGSRLSVPFIGHEYSKWAPQAYKIVIDIDAKEHTKKTISIDLFVKEDVYYVIHTLLALLHGYHADTTWCRQSEAMKKKFALKLATISTMDTNQINLYDAISEISKRSKQGDIFITDAGITAYTSMQTVHLKKEQQFLIPGATLTMGYNLPAIIGAWAAFPMKRCICITGDGSFQMNIQELATIAHHHIPAKIFIMNNQGYLAIRTTQKLFFQQRYIGEGKESGISFPNVKCIAQAYHIQYSSVSDVRKLAPTITKALHYPGPIICDIHLPYWQDIITVSSKKLENGKMISLPIDDMAPFLSLEDKQSIETLFTSR